MAGIIAVLYASICGLPVPFAPVHLLFMNLLTDSLPAIAIGMEPAEDNLLSKKPRNPKDEILNKSFLLSLLFEGGLIAVCTLIAFHIGLNSGSEILAGTMAFSTLTTARLFHGFNCRSDQSVFKIGFKSNMASIYAFVSGIVLLLLVLFVPFLKILFETAPLNIMQIISIILLALTPTVIIQLSKLKS